MTYQSGFKAAIQKAAELVGRMEADYYERDKMYASMAAEEIHNAILALQPDETVSDEPVKDTRGKGWQSSAAWLVERAKFYPEMEGDARAKGWFNTGFVEGWQSLTKELDRHPTLNADTTALREVCLRVAERAQENYHPSGWCLTPGEIVSEVLNENRI